MSVTADSYGAGDKYFIYHMDTVATVGGTIIKTLAEDIYNLGGGISIMHDFATLELVAPNESIRFVYQNVATTAMSVYVTIETIR